MKKNNFKMVLPICLVLLTCYNCNNSTTGPVKQISGAVISLEEVSCIEVWLRINKGDAPSGTKITLQKNNKEQLTFNLTGNDTIICVDSLLSGKSYVFQAFLNQAGISEAKTNSLTLKTLSQTSHNINWQMVYIGDYTSNYLNEVAIINENDIWAVGEFYLNDSTGKHEIKPYNAVHWDGSKWNPYRVSVKLNYGSSVFITDADVMNSVAISADSTIWFISRAGGVAKLKSNAWEMLLLPAGVGPGLTEKIWINKNNEMYCADSYGTVWYYDYANWKEIPCGTTTSINDIWGYTDQKTGNEILYGAVTSMLYGGDKKIIRITEKTKVDSIIIGNNRNVESVWTFKGIPIYVCGDGIFKNKKGNWEEIKVGNNYTKLVRGNGLNDIFICGDFGFLAHFNGVDWRVYYELQSNYSSFNSFAIKGNLIVAVGDDASIRKAMIAIGKR